MDKLSAKHRSWNMSRIGSKDTKPEKTVRSYLHTCGVRYRCSPKDVVGKPDICIKCYGLVLFVHGCFWHGHENCKHFRLPKTNTDFWERKLSRNIKRDQEVNKELIRRGYSVHQVWECEIKAGRFSKLEAFIEAYNKKRFTTKVSSH